MQDYSAVIKELKENRISFKTLEPMSEHTTFKIGGPADIFIEVQNSDAAINAIEILRKYGVEISVIGHGSNLLVSDKGISGAVVCFNSAEEIEIISGELLSVSAGVMLNKLCCFAKDNSLTGLEFAFGIPGTVGGAVYMNAGAYDGCVKDVLHSAECLMPDGSVKTFSNEECDFSYRKSAFVNNGAVILRAVFRLTKGNKQQIADKMSDLMNRRRTKQPLEFPSAGSTFKRPEGYFAGTLIEQSGLKGYSVGGAEVSEKHAGFVINRNNATSNDVLCLVEDIKRKVFEKFGVNLEPEIKILGRE